MNRLDSNFYFYVNYCEHFMQKKYFLFFTVGLFGFWLSAQNIALQKTVRVSSVESNNLPGSLAVDGDMSTRWSSAFSDPQYISVDLGLSYSINKVVIHWESAFASQYQLQLSTDGQQWNSIASVNNGDGGNDTFTFAPQTARYVRMYGTQRTNIGGTQFGYSIYELEVYGTVSADNAYLSGVSINGNPLSGFSSTQYTYDYMLPPETNTIPTVTVTTANSAATYDIDDATSLTGTTTITVTSADNTQIKQYFINFFETSYTLMWSDEFNYTGPLDDQKWHHQTFPPNNSSWFNNEEQHYTDRDENSYVSNGSLKITAIKELYQDPTSGTTKNYTSARLNSKYAFKYGRMEVRAKLPSEMGTWPAIWTLGQNINENGAYWQTLGYGTTNWPYCGEIDIMEQDSDKSKTSGAFHFPDANGDNTYTTNHITVSDTEGTWHVYSMEWTEEIIKLMVDDTVFHSLNNAENPYFDNEHFILLNIAMGGTLGQTIDPDFSTATMEIDYVRVFQAQPLSSKMLQPTAVVDLFPNPSLGEVHIKSNKELRQITIYDLTGRILLKNPIDGYSTTLNVKSTPGLYVVKIEGENFVTTKKLIVR